MSLSPSLPPPVFLLLFAFKRIVKSKDDCFNMCLLLYIDGREKRHVIKNDCSGVSILLTKVAFVV